MDSNELRQKSPAELIDRVIELESMVQEYRILLDDAADAIAVFYPNGLFRYVNKAFAKSIGKEADEIIGLTIWQVFSKTEAERRFAVVREVFDSGQSRTVETRLPRNGGDHFLATTARPINDEKQNVVSVICTAREITELRQLEERLARMAQYDELTDLPNRTLFNDRLWKAITQARRRCTRVALLLIDLDGFQAVNERFGRQVGDALLQTAAARILETIRESDSAGRIGGDEFVVLLPFTDDETNALVVADKIRLALSQPFTLPEHGPITITACIGIAIYPDHGTDEFQLYKRADRAMYDAKSAGRNQTQIFAAKKPET